MKIFTTRQKWHRASPERHLDRAGGKKLGGSDIFASALMQSLQTQNSPRNEVAWGIEGAQAVLEPFASPDLLSKIGMRQYDQMRLYIPSPPTNTALTFRSTMAAAAPSKRSSGCVRTDVYGWEIQILIQPDWSKQRSQRILPKRPSSITLHPRRPNDYLVSATLE